MPTSSAAETRKWAMWDTLQSPLHIFTELEQQPWNEQRFINSAAPNALAPGATSTILQLESRELVRWFLSTPAGCCQRPRAPDTDLAGGLNCNATLLTTTLIAKPHL